MIWRGVYLAVCGLLLAGIVHIAIVLLVPAVGTQDAYGVATRQLQSYAFTLVGDSGQVSVVRETDPFFAYGVCRFDLAEGGVRMTGPQSAVVWSATLVDQDGGVIYSLNNRTAIESRLNLIVLNPAQILRLRETQPPEIESSVVVEADVDAGFVVLRAFRPDDSWAGLVDEFMKGVQCDSYRPADSSAPASPES